SAVRPMGLGPCRCGPCEICYGRRGGLRGRCALATDALCILGAGVLSAAGVLRAAALLRAALLRAAALLRGTARVLPNPGSVLRPGLLSAGSLVRACPAHVIPGAA